MKLRTIKEMKELSLTGEFPSENHVSPRDFVKDLAALFLDLPYESINFRKLNLGRAVTTAKKYELDKDEIDGLSDEQLDKVLSSTHTCLHELNFDKGDIVYLLGLRTHASEAVEAAEKEFFAKLNHGNFLSKLVTELSDKLTKFKRGNNGLEYFRSILFSHTFPSLSSEKVPEEKSAFLGMNPPPVFPMEKITNLEKRLGEWYTPKTLKSAGIVLPHQQEIPPLKFLEKFSDVLVEQEKQATGQDYFLKLEQAHPSIVSHIPARDIYRFCWLMQFSRIDREKALSECFGDNFYFEGKVLEDELGATLPEMGETYSRLYVERALLTRYLGEKGETQYKLGVPQKLFAAFLEDLERLEKRSLIALEAARSSHYVGERFREYHAAPLAILEMYSQAISRWNGVGSFQSVVDVLIDYQKEAVKQRNSYLTKLLVFKFGDIFTPVGCRLLGPEPSPEPWQREAYNSFLKAQEFMEFDSSKKYVQQVVELFDGVSKIR